MKKVRAVKEVKGAVKGVKKVGAVKEVKTEGSKRREEKQERIQRQGVG